MQQQEAAALTGEQVAVRLGVHLRADSARFAAPIADVTQWAYNVEIELKSGAMWTAECLDADAYHFYPAHIEEGRVVWLNVWVADDLSLDETITRINEEVFHSSGKEV